MDTPNPQTARPDARLAAILFRVGVMLVRLLAHEYQFKITFELPKDAGLLRIRKPENSDGKLKIAEN